MFPLLFFFSFFFVFVSVYFCCCFGRICVDEKIMFDALINASIQSHQFLSPFTCPQKVCTCSHTVIACTFVVILWLPGLVVVLWLPVLVVLLWLPGLVIVLWWLPVLVVIQWLPVLVVRQWLPVLVVTLWWLPLTMVFWSSDSRTTSWTISSLVRGCVTSLASSWTSTGWLGHKMTSRIRGSILGCCPSLLVPNIFMDVQFLWFEDELECCLVMLKI